uniref:Uncharacterized protein n=1 Tax=viral metagenome TaxID=1070528 RepID=A0A6C0LXT1_9ZZZZ
MPIHLKPGQAIDVRTKKAVTILHPKFVYSVYKTSTGKMRKMYRLVGTGGSPNKTGKVSRIVPSDLKGFGVAKKVLIKRKPAAKKPAAKKAVKKPAAKKPAAKKAVKKPAAKKPAAKKPAAKKAVKKPAAKKVLKKCVAARVALATAKKRVTVDKHKKKKACAPKK